MKENNIHATCVAIDGKGILILGKSGSGKSDLALRLIEYKGAVLVSDDRTDIDVSGDKLIAKAPKLLKGLLEVRGVGIAKFESVDKADVKLVVNLIDDIKKIERMPEEKFYVYNSIKIPMINIYPFEITAADKVVIKLKANLEK